MAPWLVVLLVGVGCLGSGLLLGFGAAVVRGLWHDIGADYWPSVN